MSPLNAISTCSLTPIAVASPFPPPENPALATCFSYLSCSVYAYCMLRCVFPTSNAASAHMPTASASARSQLADLHSGSSTPSKAASRPAHRLQVQSTPSTAEASVHGQENLQEASPTSGAAGPVAARPDAAEPDAEEPVTAGPDVAGPETAEPDPARPDAAELNPPGPDAAGLSADTVEGVPGEDSCDAAEREAAHTVADVQSMASCSITKTDDASRLAAARPRLRGLRLPWLDNQAGHRPEQVRHPHTPASIHHVGFC